MKVKIIYLVLLFITMVSFEKYKVNAQEDTLDNQKVEQRADTLPSSKVTLKPVVNNLAVDPTPNCNTLNVYRILNGKGFLVVSIDTISGDLYAMKIIDGVVSNRDIITKKFKTYGYSAGRVKLNSNGNTFDVMGNSTSVAQVAIKRKWFDPNYQGSGYSAGQVKQQLPKLQVIIIKYVDSKTNMEIRTATATVAYGGQYFDIEPPGTINNYKYDRTSYPDAEWMQHVATARFIYNQDINVIHYYNTDSKAIDHQPKLKQPIDGDQIISGTGISGDTVILTDNNGDKLGESTVQADGTFSIETNRPVVKDEIITATPTDKDGNIGNPGQSIVAEKPFIKDEHTVIINQPTEGEKKITGTGIPGDNVEIEDNDGIFLGEGVVKEDGSYEIEINRELISEEQITATPNKDGNEGIPSNTIVKKLGVLKLVSAPKQISFGDNLKISTKDEKYLIVEMTDKLAVQDLRTVKSSWTLTSKIISVLTSDSGKTLPNSLFYTYKGVDNLLGSDSVVVYEHLSSNEEPLVISDEWNSNEGISLRTQVGKVYPEEYGGVIEWTLLDTPGNE